MILHANKPRYIFSEYAAPITGSVSKPHVASTLRFFVKLTSIICHQVDVVVSVILSSTSCSEAYMREPHNGGMELFSAWDCLREPYAPTAKPRYAGRFLQLPSPIQPVLQDFRSAQRNQPAGIPTPNTLMYSALRKNNIKLHPARKGIPAVGYDKGTIYGRYSDVLALDDN